MCVKTSLWTFLLYYYFTSWEYWPADYCTSFQQERGVAITQVNEEVVEKSVVVFLAVKPHLVRRVLYEISRCVTQQHIIVSMAAGVTIATLEEVRILAPFFSKWFCNALGLIEILLSAQSAHFHLFLASSLFPCFDSCCPLKPVWFAWCQIFPACWWKERWSSPLAHVQERRKRLYWRTSSARADWWRRGLSTGSTPTRAWVAAVLRLWAFTLCF